MVSLGARFDSISRLRIRVISSPRYFGKRNAIRAQSRSRKFVERESFPRIPRDGERSRMGSAESAVRKIDIYRYIPGMTGQASAGTECVCDEKLFPSRGRSTVECGPGCHGKYPSACRFSNVSRRSVARARARDSTSTIDGAREGGRHLDVVKI